LSEERPEKAQHQTNGTSAVENLLTIQNTNNAKRASASRPFFFAFSARANIKFKKGGSLFNDAYLIAALPGWP